MTVNLGTTLEKVDRALWGLLNTAMDLKTYASRTLGQTVKIKFTAKAPGNGGNNISITQIIPNLADQSLAITVNNYDIVISLATNSDGAATSTAAQVAEAVSASIPARQLVVAEVVASGIAEAVTHTNLSGGGVSVYTIKVLQQSSPDILGALKNYDIIIILDRGPVSDIKERGGDTNIFIGKGDLVEKIVDGVTVSGYERMDQYSEERWVRAEYRVRYLTKTITMDRWASEQLLRIWPGGYIDAQTGVSVHIAPSSDLMQLSPIENEGIWERLRTWNVEIPLLIEAVEEVPTITDIIGVEAVQSFDGGAYAGNE